MRDKLSPREMTECKEGFLFQDLKEMSLGSKTTILHPLFHQHADFFSLPSYD